MLVVTEMQYFHLPIYRRTASPAQWRVIVLFCFMCVIYCTVLSFIDFIGLLFSVNFSETYILQTYALAVGDNLISTKPTRSVDSR